MSYRTRAMALGALVGLPLLVLSIISALRLQAERERALNEERLETAGAVAAAVEIFLESDIAALRAVATLPAVRDFQRSDDAEVERALLSIFTSFHGLETIGLIGRDGWNVRSLARSGSIPPRTVNVSDRPYFRQALESGAVVVSPAILSSVRPSVPVVAIAFPLPSHRPSASRRYAAFW